MHIRTIFGAALCVLLCSPAVTQPAHADEPTVSITGNMAAATYAVAAVEGVRGTVSYAWTVDGDPVEPVNLAGAPTDPSTLLLLEEFLGSDVVVTATVAPEAGGAPLTMVSEPRTVVEGTVLANPPRIEGDYLVGHRLTARPQPVYPKAGLTYSYQWYLRGVPVPGATAKEWIPGPEAESGWVFVEVTAAKPGWTTSVTRNSNLHPTLRLPYVSASGASLTGELLVGSQVGVELHDPVGSPFDLLIEWSVGGRSAGTGYHLRLTPDMLGLPVVAKVTMTAERVDPFTVVTPEAKVGMRVWNGESGFSGPAMVGWVTRAKSHYEGYPVTETVTWLRDGVVIPGATGWSYRYTGADAGKTVVAQIRAQGRGIDATYRWRSLQPVAFNVYTTEGEHQVNGRKWRTRCEPYSSTIRCRTEIWATQVVKVSGRWTQRHGYVFNNLTYVPLMSGSWGRNPLAVDGAWADADGRAWRTECGTAATGRGACRTYVFTHVTSNEGGRYQTRRQWVFNNVVYL